MDAVLFLKEWKRMCDDMSCCVGGCPINIEFADECGVAVRENPEKAVEIVEKWSRENPVKTMMDDFLEKFPNAPKDEDGTPIHCCPYYVGYVLNRGCPEVDGREMECIECWSRPLEESK